MAKDIYADIPDDTPSTTASTGATKDIYANLPVDREEGIIGGPSTLTDSLQGFGHGSTFGIMPYVNAGIDTGINAITGHGSTDYGQNVDIYQRADKAAQADSPVAYGAGGIAGSAPVYALTKGRIAPLMGLGAVQGAADSEHVSDAPMNAATGAAINGALGTAGKAVGAASNWIGDKIARSGLLQSLKALIADPSEAATQKLHYWLDVPKEDLQQQGVNVRDIAKDAITDLERKGPASEAMPLARDDYRAIQAVQPTAMQHGKEVLKAGINGAFGAGGTAAVNYAAGNPVDPVLAMGAGALAGSSSAAREALTSIAKHAITKAYLASTGELYGPVSGLVAGNVGSSVNSAASAPTTDVYSNLPPAEHYFQRPPH